MNLLIIKTINYEGKNKNKKFNSALKTETSENKDEFKSHNKNKNKNKSKTKFKKSNKISISNNVEKKKFTYINCNYCERQHSVSYFYKHSEFAEKKWQKINKIEINCLKKKNKLKKNNIIQFQSLIRFFCSDLINLINSCYSEEEF